MNTARLLLRQIRLSRAGLQISEQAKPCCNFLPTVAQNRVSTIFNRTMHSSNNASSKSRQDRGVKLFNEWLEAIRTASLKSGQSKLVLPTPSVEMLDCMETWDDAYVEALTELPPPFNGDGYWPSSSERPSFNGTTNWSWDIETRGGHDEAYFNYNAFSYLKNLKEGHFWTVYYSGADRTSVKSAAV